jgi:prenyltransferase beta subunit
MSILTIDTKTNCYVIDPNQMNNLQLNVASTFTFEKGTFDIKIASGRYRYAKAKTEGEPFVLLWIYGVDGSKFINKTTGYEVGATWTTLNGSNDNLQLEVKQRAVLNALFFDVNNNDNSGSIDLLITSNKPFFNPQTLTVDSKRNSYVLDENQLASLKQSGTNSIELNPGNYRLKIREGNATYWSDNNKFNLEPWALIWVKGGKFITKLTGIEVEETWTSLNGFKDEVVLEVKEKTTLTGLFVDTYKEDNEGQIILAIESVSATTVTNVQGSGESTSREQTYYNSSETVTNVQGSGESTSREAVGANSSETVTNVQGTGGSTSREAVGASSSTQFTFRFNEDELKKKWEEQLQQINASIKVIDENDVKLEGQYWEQLEQWLLKNYEKQFKNLAIEVAKVRFTMDAYTQQMEFSLNQQLQGWSSYLDKLVENRINVEISNKINQQINQYVDQTFEQKIRNNIGLIINNILRKQELNQYIDQQVNQQIDSAFEQKIRSNIGLIINNLVNKQELNQYIDRHVDGQIDSSFEQKIRNNINLITQNLVNDNTDLNQYVSQQIDNTYEQKVQNNLHLITQNIVNNNEELNRYIDQRLQQTVTNNSEVNNAIVNLVSNSTEINNKIENLRNEWNRTFLNLATQHVDELSNIIGGTDTFNRVITQKLVNNNTELEQYVSQQIDNTYEQKVQNNLHLITQNIVNNNEELNRYIDQRLQQTVTNNSEVNNEIVNLVSNSTEINNKIENLRNEWNRTFINLATQHVDELSNIIGGTDTFNRVITQKLVNNNTELEQYVSQQIDNTYEQKVQNNLHLITQNIVNNNEELNRYIDQRLQQTVTNNSEVNNEIVNLVSNSTEINNKIENLRNEWNRTFLNLATQHVDELSNIIGGTDTFNRVITQKLVNNNTELEQYVSQQIDNTYEQKVQNNLHLITQNIVNNNEELNRYIDQRLQQTVTNNSEVNNEIVNLVSNSTEINNKIENLRNEWNRTFLNLATQHVDELSNIIGGTDTFNRVITQKLVNNNTELEQYVSQQIDNTYEQKVQNNLHLITQNIVNNNEELNRYIDQRLQQTVTNNSEVNNEIVNLVSNSTEINNKIENLRNEWNRTFLNLATQHVDELSNIIGGTDTFNRVITQKLVNNNTELNNYVSQQIDSTYEQKVRNYISVITQNIVNNNEGLNQYIDQRLHQNVINNSEVNNEIVNLVANSTEINNKINNVYRDIDIKIDSVRNEWNQTFLNLVRQYVDEVINIIGDRDTFNTQVANIINIKVDDLLNQIIRTKNELTVLINSADRQLYEWTLGELMAIKGCLTDREVLVETLVTFSAQLRTKLDGTPCVDINTFKPFKPISIDQQQSSNYQEANN